MLSSKIPVTEYTRSDLWYGKYSLSLRIRLPEAHCLRSLDTKKIAHTLESRRRWGRRMMDTQGLFAHPGSWRWQELEITAEVEDNVYAMRDFMLSISRPYHKTIYGDWMYFYTNDPATLDQIEQLKFLDQSAMSRGKINCQGTPGYVRLKNPKYQYRTYLKTMQLEPNRAISLRTWLASQEDIQLSPSLKRWLAWESCWIEGYYFIDCDLSTVTTMLNMIVPGVTRKTLPIEKAK